MKSTFLILSLLLATLAPAQADVLPKAEKFSRYEPMLKHSPFAVASAVAPVVDAPAFTKDLYLANAALSSPDNTGYLTVASTSDRNLKEYLSTKEPNEHGYAVVSIQWSDRVGETKATISKDGQSGSIGFNEAVLSEVMPNTPVAPLQAFQPPERAGRPPTNLPMPLPRPMAIPTIPTPPPHIRNVIRRGGALQKAREVPRPEKTPLSDDDGNE